MADTKVPALTALSTPAFSDVFHIVDVSDTTDDATGSSRYGTLSRVGGFINPSLSNGRLTLESGVPFSTSDQSAKTSVFFTPYRGNRIAIYDGTRWEEFSFSELTLSVGTLTNAKNYDVFIFSSSGTPTLEFSAAWTNDTTRADALTTQDGIHVKNGATSRRYVGTIRTTSTTTTEDSRTKRFVYNYQNQGERSFRVFETADSWSYNSTTWRPYNNNTGNRVEVVVGLAGNLLDLTAIAYANNNGNNDNGAVAIGEDSTNTPLGDNLGIWLPNQVAASATVSKVIAPPALGYHFYQMIEKTLGFGAGMTFYGDAGFAGSLQSGMNGKMLM